VAEIILIRPKYTEISSHLKESRPPAGLLYVAATLVQHNFDVVIIDQSVEKEWENRLIAELNEKTIFVGITCLTGYMILNGIEIVKIVRRHSQCPVVWGGVHPYLEPDSTIASEYVDIIVVGEGEETAVELASVLKFGGELKDIEGIIYKKDGKIIKNKYRALYNLNELPELPLHLVNWELYRNHSMLYEFFNFRNPLAISIETSRGCTHRCRYCVEANETHIKTGNSSWRYMKAEKIVDIIEYAINRYGIKSFTVIDDNFFVHIERVKKFCDELERRGLAIEWFAEIRTDTITKRMDIPFLERLQRSGLRSIGVGIESGSDKILKYLNKGETVETYIEANRMLAHTHIRVQYGLILGLPYEKKEDVVKSYKLVIQLLRENSYAAPKLNKLLPTPNTPIMNDCIKLGFKKPSRFEEWYSYCDTNWFNGPGVWMDKETTEFIMSQLHFQYVLSVYKQKRSLFWRMLYRCSSALLLFRIERDFYSLRFEKKLIDVIRNPLVMGFLRRVLNM
jgi:radical SAM superfamily enzyme YgiQ (UPF0313 family)